MAVDDEADGFRPVLPTAGSSSSGLSDIVFLIHEITLPTSCVSSHWGATVVRYSRPSSESLWSAR